MPKHEYAAYASIGKGRSYDYQRQNISTLNSAKREAQAMLDDIYDVYYVWVEDEDCRVVWKKGR